MRSLGIAIVGIGHADLLGGRLPDRLEARIEFGLMDLLTALRPLFGPTVVAEGFELFPPPVLDVNDPEPETATVTLPDDVYLFSLGLLDIGGAFGPLSELFSGAVNLNFDRDADDDDAEQVLREIVTGEGGAALDRETEPGIDGVTLLSLTADAYTLAFDNGEAIDVLTLDGAGAARAIAAVDGVNSPVDLSDGVNALALVDLDEETVSAGVGDANPIPDIADAVIDSAAELAALLQAALDPGDDMVDLLAVEPDAFTVRVANPATGAFDLLVLSGGPAPAAVASVATDRIGPGNAASEIVLADALDGRAVVAEGPGLDAILGGEGLAPVGPTLTGDELLDLLATADARPKVNAIDQGGTVRLEIPGTSGSRDVIVLATTEAVPGGAFDGDLLA